MTDSLDRLLRECDTELSSCEQHGLALRTLSAQAAQWSEAQMASWTHSDGIAWRSFHLASQLNDAALPRAHDIQVNVSLGIIEEELAGLTPQQIVVPVDGATLTLRPRDAPQFLVADRYGVIPPVDGFLLLLSWEASGDFGNAFELQMILSCTLHADPLTPVCRLLPACSVRLFDGTGAPFTLLKKLPVGSATYARQHLFDEIDKFLASSPMSMLPPSAAELLGGSGFEGRRLRSALLLTALSYQKRRRPLPLLRDPAPGEDILVNLQHPHILAEVRKVAAEQGGSVRTLTLRDGYAETTIDVRHREEFLHIAVISNVSLQYDLVFVAPLARLRADANMTYWRYEITAKRCWPVCDKVLGMAEREVKARIQNASSSSTLLADLSSDFRRCNPSLSRSGLLLILTRR